MWLSGSLTGAHRLLAGSGESNCSYFFNRCKQNACQILKKADPGYPPSWLLLVNNMDCLHRASSDGTILDMDIVGHRHKDNARRVHRGEDHDPVFH
jgi:hypothetical protein